MEWGSSPLVCWENLPDLRPGVCPGPLKPEGGPVPKICEERTGSWKLLVQCWNPLFQPTHLRKVTGHSEVHRPWQWSEPGNSGSAPLIFPLWPPGGDARCALEVSGEGIRTRKPASYWPGDYDPHRPCWGLNIKGLEATPGVIKSFRPLQGLVVGY
jgi:hypothetical protein